MSEGDFHFTDKDFRTIVDLLGKRAGIVLTDAKRNMVYSRLARRLRTLGLSHFKHYLEVVQDEASGELLHFTNALTTNLTAFFREQHHFDYLAKTLLPEVMRNNARSRKVRIWSAGCSTGEEPYSIAQTLRETIPAGSGWDTRILATDLDSNVVATADAGVYSMERVKGIPKARLSRWFLRGKNGQEGMVRVKSELREMITFQQLNLLESWPFRGPFDAIFCRNVVIYFNKQTQAKLVDRYADMMVDGGILFLGHSESLFKVTDRFELIGNTIYRKIA